MQPGVCFALWGFKKIISGLGDSSNYCRLAGELFAACHRPWERVPNGGPAARALGSGDSTQNKATLMVSGHPDLEREGQADAQGRPQAELVTHWSLYVPRLPVGRSPPSLAQSWSPACPSFLTLFFAFGCCASSPGRGNCKCKSPQGGAEPPSVLDSRIVLGFREARLSRSSPKEQKNRALEREEPYQAHPGVNGKGVIHPLCVRTPWSWVWTSHAHFADEETQTQGIELWLRKYSGS